MFKFNSDGSFKDISDNLKKIRNFSSKMDEKIKEKGLNSTDNFVETLSVEELKDFRQVIMAVEYLLSKYQHQKEIKEFLEEFIATILHATNSVNTLRDEVDDLLISGEVALKQILDLHEDLTKNLVLEKAKQKSLDEFREKNLEQNSGSINLTNTAIPIYTQAYLTKNAVEI